MDPRFFAGKTLLNRTVVLALGMLVAFGVLAVHGAIRSIADLGSTRYNLIKKNKKWWRRRG